MTSTGKAPKRDVAHPDVATLQEWRPGYISFLAASALVALVGFGALGLQWRTGLGITGMNTPTYWGLYVVNFVFMVGVSAGGILIASLVYALGVRRFEPVGRIAELLAIVSLLLAVIFITVDMGRPDRVLNLLLYGRLSSPLIWDFAVVAIYLSTALALGYFATRSDLVQCVRDLPQRRGLYRLMLLGYRGGDAADESRDRQVLRVLAWIAIPGAVALHSVTAWIMGLLKARIGWHNALLAPLFIISALLSGLALLTLVVIVARRPLRLRIDDHLISDLGRFLAWGLPVLGYFLFAEWLTVVYAGETGPLAVFRSMFRGRFAGLFWFDLVGGLVLPWFLLVLTRLRSVTATGIAAALVVAGVLAERALIVLPSLAHPRLPVGVVPYNPTLLETLIVIGVYALGTAVFALLAKLIPLVSLEQEGV